MHRDTRLNYIPFAGLNFGELLAPNIALIRGGVDIKVIQKAYISIRGNIGFDTESRDDMISFMENSSIKAYKTGYAAGIRADLPIGPLQIMIADNDFDGKVRWYFSLGFPF